MEIRTLDYNDILFLAELQPPDWKNILPVFEIYTKSSFCFPIKVIADNKIIGVGTSIVHNNTAWLAHIIVHPSERNKGIGRLITSTLVDGLHTKNCDTVYLIASDLGVPVYEKLGFVTDTEYLFFKDIQIDPGGTTSKNIIPFADNFKKKILNLDRLITGEDRMFQTEQYLKGGYVYQHDKVVEGFYLPAFGEGLILATEAIDGLELIKLRLTTKDHSAFPIDNKIATNFFYQLGYTAFKTAKRMRLGKKKNWLPANMYNRTGGNLG